MLSHGSLPEKFTLTPSYDNSLKQRAAYSHLILFFVLLKVGLNLLAITHFGLQRDELLYMVLGEHLGWGFKEVPPFIALIAKLSSVLFGNSLFATRLFSTAFGGLIVWFTGLIVVEFGGGRFAIVMASLALIFSPAFAASGYLFEPVVYDQLWWVLTVWLLIRYIKTSSAKYLYVIGVVTGIGLLTKYSMTFFSISLIAGLLINGRGKQLWNKHVLGAILLTALLVLPNLVWEVAYHMPIITQMKELRASQLDHITPADFIVQQLFVNGMFLILWLPGLWLLLFSEDLRQFRFLAFAFISVFIFLLVMSGKNYYILGAYPMLFAAGAFGIEKWLKEKAAIWGYVACALLVIPNVAILPLALPVLPLDQTIAYFRFDCEHLPFLLFEAKWDDEKIHPLTQNYGVMLGWDEMAAKAANAYYGLTPDQRKHTLIYAANYGEASALSIYGKRYKLPQVVSLNSSFSMWAPPKMKADYIIYVGDKGDKMAQLLYQADISRKLDEVTNPLAVEKGTGIFLFIHPKPGFYATYEKAFARLRQE